MNIIQNIKISNLVLLISNFFINVYFGFLKVYTKFRNGIYINIFLLHYLLLNILFNSHLYIYLIFSMNLVVKFYRKIIFFIKIIKYGYILT